MQLSIFAEGSNGASAITMLDESVRRKERERKKRKERLAPTRQGQFMPMVTEVCFPSLPAGLSLKAVLVEKTPVRTPKAEIWGFKS